MIVISYHLGRHRESTGLLPLAYKKISPDTLGVWGDPILVRWRVFHLPVGAVRHQSPLHACVRKGSASLDAEIIGRHQHK